MGNSSYTRMKGVNFSILIALVFVIFIGLRDPYGVEFGDSQLYTLRYFDQIGETFIWDQETNNFLYDNIFLLFSTILLFH